MTHATDAAAVKSRLIGDLENFLRTLLPEGKIQGHQFKVGSVNGEAGGSLAVELRGPKAGLWVDRNGGKDGGDIYALAGAVWNTDFRETLKKCCEYLGISHVERPMPKPRPAAPDITPMGRVLGSNVYAHLNQVRGISEASMRKYGLRTYGRRSEWNTDFIAFTFRTPDGQLVFIKTKGIHNKPDGKKDIWSTPPWWTLWGWWLVKPHHRAIIITEGEEDAMSADQMLEADVPVLSLPNGTNSMEWIENDYEALRQFEVIYAFTDADEPGENCAKEIARRLGRTRVRRIRMHPGYKDANDLLTKGEDIHQSVDSMLEQATTYDPTALTRVEDLTGDLMNLRRRHREAKAVNDFIWPQFAFQYRDGETTIISGYPESGKSTFCYQTHLHEMKSGKVVLMCSYEIPVAEMLNKFIELMGIPSDAPAEMITEALRWLNDWLVFIRPGDVYPFESLCDDITYAVQRYGARRIAIDSIHYLADKDDYNEQDKVSRTIHKMGISLNVHMGLVCHSPKSKDMNHIPGMMDVEGSGGIIKPVDNVVVIHRNIAKEEALQKAREAEDQTKIDAALKAHDGAAYVRKQRLTGKHPIIRLWHDGVGYRTTLEPVDPVPLPEKGTPELF